MDSLPMLPGSCSLDQSELTAQLGRYRAVGDGAQVIEQDGRRLTVRLRDQISIGAIEEVVAIERACCPFFELDWDPEARRLTVAVSRREQEPALRAVAHALGVTAPDPG